MWLRLAKKNIVLHLETPMFSFHLFLMMLLVLKFVFPEPNWTFLLHPSSYRFLYLFLQYGRVKLCGSIISTSYFCVAHANIHTSERLGYWIGSFRYGHTSYTFCCSMSVNDEVKSTTWVNLQFTKSWLSLHI